MYLARSAAVAALISAALLCPIPASASTINTGVSTTSVCNWGYNDYATHGQTIVAPADSVLDRWSFYASQDTVGPQTIAYRAYVYAWDGAKAVGGPLYTSGLQEFTTAPAPVEVKVETGGVPLVAGQQYVLFVSTSADFEANSAGDLACWMDGAFAYADGAWRFQLNGTDESQWTQLAWFGGDDTAFRAEFSPPAPTTVYDFDGFYAPVNNRDANGHYVLNRVRAGSGIPVRFSLGGDQGLDIFEAGYPRSQTIECSSQAEVDGIEQTVEAGGSSLSYVAGSDTYTYVWKTDKSWADTCRQLVVKFDDGTTARANFMLTK